MVVLADAEIRKSAVYGDGDELLVEAGAGTGKTSILVSKVVHLIKDRKVKIANIAAITFTEAAAEELAQRIERELRRESEALPDNKYLATALSELAGASITTIHGFAQSILMRYGYKIGLPSELTILDESVIKYRLKKQFTSVFYELLTDKDKQDVIILAQALGLSDYHFNELWQLCNENWYLVPAAFSEGDFDVNLLVRKLTNDIETKAEQLCSLASDCRGYMTSCVDQEDKLFLLLKKLSAWSDLLGAEPGVGEILDWISLIQDPRGTNKGNKKNWPGVDINSLRTEIEQISSLRKSILQVSLDQILPVVLAQFLTKAKEMALARKFSGELRFQDLLVYCRELLMTNFDIRQKVILQYSHILVDEFQDTDQLQLDIVNLLGRRNNENEQGVNLFYVGDPKQSIYRFRGADIELYRKVRSYSSKDKPLEITTNFRSRPLILEAVNKLFANLLQADGDIVDNSNPTYPISDGEDTSLAFRPLIPARENSADEREVMFFGGPMESNTTAGERRRCESRDIAAVIQKVLRESWTVEDNGQTRPAELRDIAIIIPKRTGLAELKTALEEAKIAYKLPSSELVFSNPLVQDLIACIKAVIFPARQDYILAALRSTVFGCGDSDLLEYRLSGGKWVYEGDAVTLDRYRPVEISYQELSVDIKEANDNSLKVLSALQEIVRLHKEAFTYGPIVMLSRLVDKSNLYALANLLDDPVETKIALDYVIDKILIYCRDNDNALYDLTDFIEAEKGNFPRAELFEEILGKSNAVNIVTIHGSKGLEYPIVLLAELGGTTTREKPAILFSDRQEENGNIVEIRVNDQIKTSGYDPATNTYTRLERAELYRLCYVAATRARDHLIVMLYHKVSLYGNPSMAQVLYEIISTDEYLSTFSASVEATDTLPGDQLLPKENTSLSSDLLQKGIEVTKEVQLPKGALFSDWYRQYKSYSKSQSIPEVINLLSVFKLIGDIDMRGLEKKLEDSHFSHRTFQLSKALINIDTYSSVVFDGSICRSVKNLPLDDKRKLTAEDIMQCLYYGNDNNYFGHNIEEIADCVDFYHREIMPLLPETKGRILKDVPVMVNSGGLFFEGQIDVLRQDSYSVMLFDYVRLFSEQKYRDLISTDSLLQLQLQDAIRLGAYTAGLRQSGFEVSKYILLCSSGQGAYSLFFTDDADTLVEIFHDFSGQLSRRQKEKT